MGKPADQIVSGLQARIQGLGPQGEVPPLSWAQKKLRKREKVEGKEKKKRGEVIKEETKRRGKEGERAQKSHFSNICEISGFWKKYKKVGNPPQSAPSFSRCWIRPGGIRKFKIFPFIAKFPAISHFFFNLVV